MFLQLPFEASEHIRSIVLIINTVLLLAALVVFELVYAERGKEQRKHLRLYFPFVAVLAGLLAYAVYRQTGGS